jgi:peptide chain release factor 2
MVLRMEMRWAEKRGFDVELLEVARGRRPASSRRPSRSRARTPTASTRREGRAPARAPQPVRRPAPPPDELRRLEVAPVVEDAAEIEIDDDDLQVDTYRASGAGRPARQQDRLGGAHHPPARAGIVVQCQNERSQSLEPRDRDGDAAREARSSARSAERQEELAKEKGEAQDVDFGSQIRSYVLHPYTMVKDHRTSTRSATPSACSTATSTPSCAPSCSAAQRLERRRAAEAARRSV